MNTPEQRDFEMIVLAKIKEIIRLVLGINILKICFEYDIILILNTNELKYKI